jgi:hypothetical protein
MSYTFKAEEHVGRWMPIGRNEQGEEVWCDGCCVEDKHLAKRIAANMAAAYKQGLEDAARDIVQQAIRIADAADGMISRTTCMGAWQVRREPRDVLSAK